MTPMTRTSRTRVSAVPRAGTCRSTLTTTSHRRFEAVAAHTAHLHRSDDDCSFFVSSTDLVTQFDYSGDPDHVEIDLSSAHVWDASTVAALDAIQTKYAARGKSVHVTGSNADSSARLERLAGHLGGGH
jgi:MFS superfamily sulfate permease-like transporter